jgi:hypothetical protein
MSLCPKEVCPECLTFLRSISVEENATSHQPCEGCGRYFKSNYLHRVSVPGYHFEVLNFLVCDRYCLSSIYDSGDLDSAWYNVDVRVVASLKKRVSECISWTKKDTRKIGPDARGRRIVGVKRDQEGYIHLLMTGGKPHYEEWYGIKVKAPVFWVGLIEVDGRTKKRFAKYIAQRDEGTKIAK